MERLIKIIEQDLKETLSSVDADVISKIFSDDTFGLASAKRGGGENDEDDDEDDDVNNMESIPVIPTAHSSDAVDYSDFDETVPDDQLSEKYYRRGMGVIQKSLPKSRLALVSDNYDDEEEEEEEQVVKQEEPTSMAQPTTTTTNIITPTQQISSTSEPMDIDKVDIQSRFPGFEKDKILKFSELFMNKIKRPPKLQPFKKGNKIIQI